MEYLTHETICDRVNEIVQLYPVKKIGYFGSYANRNHTKFSDIDFLVEFTSPFVSLFTISDMRQRLESDLCISVDLIHAPLPSDSLIEIGKLVPVYEQ
jgi:hypothetical protein